ncbi:trichothecene 3-O-acetyltransferase [Apiospora saccharicola]|uniref:Trichothecene 3-O-acetyltransferase n=1 Tax=Apiospora saccharicola TaxID=335842 RepID=A0ABR1VK80_9PEZI
MSQTLENADAVIDGYGQMLVTIFTQISLCYPMPDASRIPAHLQTLNRGLKHLTASFPWLAGHVIRESAAVGNTGVFKIAPLDQAPRMVVKDLSRDPAMPSLQDLRRAGYPMNALDEDVVAPRRTSSGQPGERIAEVFQLQATVIKGGLVLTLLGQHQCMDGVGQGQVMRLLSKACRGEEFTEEELRSGNRDPADAIPLLDESTWRPGPELKYNTVHPLPTGNAEERQTGVWCHFSFSKKSLLTLKRVATQGLPAATPYVSTDDALSALIWQSIVRARLPRLQEDSTVLFARSVDIRGHVDISATYPGFAQCMTYHDKFSIGQLVESPLGIVAADLRAAIAPETSTLAYDARSLATLVHRTPDKATVSLLGGDFDMTRDVMLNSWANQDAYYLDFGLGLGLPEAVRRPRFDAFQGLVYLLPKRPDGEVGAAVCLSEDDLQKLKDDRRFMQFARPVG